MDVCRWALQAEFPMQLLLRAATTSSRMTGSSTTPSSPTSNIDGKALSWEGRSRQGMRLYDRDRGSVIMGTKGSVVIDRGGYDVYDWKGKQIDNFRVGHAACVRGHFRRR